ncbi:MAG: response regulator [Candidatus Liptonbacteria bacterium]|nr:response regulator [Candidatus Liptonbacteria bacterium]
MSDGSLILIVDDEEYFREIFSTKLGAEGFSVETAESGEEGIKKAKKLKPNLILMDVKMPGMDGVATVMKMKEDPETKDLKVVFLTSFGSPEEELQAIDVKYSKDIGAAGYIRKTDDLDILVSKIRAFTDPS